MLKEVEIELTPAQYGAVQSRIERAIEVAWPRFDHLKESLPLWRRQQAWHPANEPPATPEAIRFAAGETMNLSNEIEFIRQTKALHAAWKSGRWDDVVKPAQPQPLPKGKRRGKKWRRIYVDAVASYNRTDVKEFPLPRTAALHHFSFPLSQTCVERTFNFLKNLKMARAERMAMKDKSITQELFLRARSKRVNRLLEKVMSKRPAPF